MDQRELYIADVHAWSKHQVGLLRSLALAGVALPNDLDLDHIAEEIEALGDNKREGMESLWTQSFVHLIRLLASPNDSYREHWLDEIDGFLVQALARYRPSMLQLIELDPLWRRAKRWARRPMDRRDIPVPPLPDSCPLDVAELLDEDMNAAKLLARLRAALGH